MNHGVIDHGVKVALLGRRGLVAVVEQIADNRDPGSVGPRVATGNGRRAVGCAVLMGMEKDVAFDPSVCAIQVENIVRRACEHIAVGTE